MYNDPLDKYEPWLTIGGWIFIITILFMVIFCISLPVTYAEYVQVKKHFPNMTFWEYIVIGKKIRITPTGDKE